MEDFGTFYDAVRVRIGAVWPEVVTSGIYEGEQAAMVPWSEMVPPFAAIITPMEAGEPLIFDTDPRQFRMDVYYLGEVNGSSKPILTKLTLLANDLVANDLSVGRVVDIGLPSCSRSLGPNAALGQQGATQRVGRLPLVCRL